MSEPKTVPGIILELFLNKKDPIEINTLMNSEKHQDKKIKFYSESAREIFINDKKHWDRCIYDKRYYHVITSLKSKVYEEVRKSGFELTNWWTKEAYLPHEPKKKPTYDHYNNPRLFAYILWNDDELFKKFMYDSELFFGLFKQLRKIVCVTKTQNVEVQLNKTTLKTGYELYDGITSTWYFNGKNNQYDRVTETNKFPSPLIQEIQKTIPFLHEEMSKSCWDMCINN